MGRGAGALTVAGQWRSFTAFPSILAIAVVNCAALEGAAEGHGTIFHDIHFYSRGGGVKSKRATQWSVLDRKKILLHCKSGRSGDPGKTRTSDTQFRKLLLYPPELRGHFRINILHETINLWTT